MTTTTANRPLPRLRALPRRLPRLAPLAAALLLALPAQAAWRITPSFSLSETYTDNVNLQSDDKKRSEWVTEAVPGIAVSGKSSRLEFDARARMYYFGYSGGDIAGTRSSESQYEAAGRANVVDDLFYVDASANRRSRGISAFGPGVDDNGNRYLDENRTDVSTWRISPYLTHRFGNFANATLRYSHDSVTTDRNDADYGDSTADGVAFDVTSGRGFRTVGWNLHYARQNIDSHNFGKSSSENAMLGLSYLLSPTLSLTATGGYDSYDYQALGGRTAGATWSTVFAWAPSPRTSIQMAIGRHYFGNTGSLKAMLRKRHSVWNLSYSDAVTSTRQQFTLPSAIDTASMLDALFMSSIPDPVLRRQAVEAYIRAAGLPPTLADSVNYLSNRYMRQKLLQGSVAFNWRRSGAVFSTYASEREALTSSEADSGLLGSQLRTLNDHVRQVGMNANFNYRLSGRTDAVAALSASHARSLRTSLEEDRRELRVGLSRRFGRSVRGNLEVRHLVGDSDFQRRDYTENAVTATLSVQL